MEAGRTRLTQRQSSPWTGGEIEGIEDHEGIAPGLALEELGPNKLVRFPERNLFFGGVHLVQRSPDGTLRGAGDPRRGGICITV